MKDLRHDNLNSFIGACVEPEQIRIVSEYCTRGSLRYVLKRYLAHIEVELKSDETKLSIAIITQSILETFLQMMTLFWIICLSRLW